MKQYECIKSVVGIDMVGGISRGGGLERGVIFFQCRGSLPEVHCQNLTVHLAFETTNWGL